MYRPVGSNRTHVKDLRQSLPACNINKELLPTVVRIRRRPGRVLAIPFEARDSARRVSKFRPPLGAPL